MTTYCKIIVWWQIKVSSVRQIQSYKTFSNICIAMATHNGFQVNREYCLATDTLDQTARLLKTSAWIFNILFYFIDHLRGLKLFYLVFHYQKICKMFAQLQLQIIHFMTFLLKKGTHFTDNVCLFFVSNCMILNHSTNPKVYALHLYFVDNNNYFPLSDLDFLKNVQYVCRKKLFQNCLTCCSLRSLIRRKVIHVLICF